MSANTDYFQKGPIGATSNIQKSGTTVLSVGGGGWRFNIFNLTDDDLGKLEAAVEGLRILLRSYEADEAAATQDDNEIAEEAANV